VNGVVYALYDPRTLEPRYVGATANNDPTPRLRHHLSAARRGARLPVAQWIAKLLREGVEPHMWVLSRWQAPDRDVYDLEVEMIERFTSYGHRLLNLTPGGRGGGIGPKSPEHRARISAALKGRKAPPRSAEWRAAHAAKLTGRTQSEATSAKKRATAARRRAEMLVVKTCRCGNEFSVLPSRVDRKKYCSPECVRTALRQPKSRRTTEGSR